MSNVLIRRIKKDNYQPFGIYATRTTKPEHAQILEQLWIWHGNHEISIVSATPNKITLDKSFHLCNHIVINQSQLESNWPVKLWCTDTWKWTTYRILSYQILHFLCKMTKIHVPTISMTCFFHIHAVSRSLGIIAVKCKTTENLIK